MKENHTTDSPDAALSRRNLLAMASAPMVAAAVLNALPQRASAQANEPTTRTSDLGARVYNVRAFGAKGDGQTLDTAAVQAAIDACTGDHGGTVLVPAGDFLIGPVQLKSNVTLRITAGGTLLATTDVGQYHPAPGISLQGDHTMGDGNVGLVTGSDAQNITIEGTGTIDGQGAAVRAAGLSGNRRPHLVLFYRCTNLTIRDVYLYHSAYHTCRIANSSYVRIDGVRINCRTTGNNDGFHFISAEYVNLTNCNVRCQDDACALFGSCKFIMVTNCSFSTRWSVFRFGGGIAENIAVSNCLFRQVLGCPIKLRCEPGSRYENMSFSNLIFQDVTGPICVQAGPQRAGSSGGDAAIVRNISFSDISGTVVTQPTKLDDSNVTGGTNSGEQHSCIILNCVEGNTMENIRFSGIHLTFGGGGTAEDAARRELPNIAAEYFSLGPMPAYGLYARNARGVTINDVRLQVAAPDLRPAIIFGRVQDAAINGLSVQGNKDAPSVVRLINTQDALMAHVRLLTPATVFLAVEGAECKNIQLDGGDLSKSDKVLTADRGAAIDGVKLHD